MSINITPIDPFDLHKQPQNTRTFAQELDGNMSREGLLLGIGRVGQLTRTSFHRLVTPDSEEWQLLQNAADLAYNGARDFLGPEFCDTLCNWIRCIGEIHLYRADQMIRPENTGITDLIDDTPPVLHIVLYRNTEHLNANLENARTFKHELFHTRGYHLPVRLTSLEEGIKNQFKEYHDRGLTDRITYCAINQEHHEQLSWAMEALNLGVDQTHSDDWRKPRPELVDLIQQHKPQIAGWEPPKRQLARKLTTTQTQQENNMTTQPAAVLTSSSTQTSSDKDQPNEYEHSQNEDTRKRPKQRFVCIRPPATGSFYPTHPLSRGVLRWLKVQAQNSLESPVCRWNGCYPEYQQLRDGTHPDPKPGLIITPDNPDRFKPEQIDVSHELPLIDMETDPILSKTLLSSEDYPLYQLELTVATIDRSAWYAVKKIRKQQVTSELYVEACIEELEKELSRHEYGRRIQEDPEYARQIQIQWEELHASITARNQPLQEQGVVE